MMGNRARHVSSFLRRGAALPCISDGKQMKRKIMTDHNRKNEKTALQLCKKWTKKLQSLNIPEAKVSTEIIIAHALGEKMFHRVNPGAILSGDKIKDIEEMMKKRINRMPVQYIIGEWDFLDMTLEMRPPVLIPRTETEELANLVQKSMELLKYKNLRLLEIGCGSGAISIYLLRKFTEESYFIGPIRSSDMMGNRARHVSSFLRRGAALPCISDGKQMKRKIMTDHNRKNEKTALQLCKKWTKKLQSLNIPEAKVSTEIIIAHALGEKMFHRVNPGAILSGDKIKDIEEMMKKRINRMPVQYIIGEWDFLDMTLEMRPPVLIPRTETEELADLVQKSMESLNYKNLQLLEIGCGSGAISIYLLRKFTEMTCMAIDISPAACSLTETNAALQNVDDRLTVKNLDLTSSDATEELRSGELYDVIVSNPPYIVTEDIPSLEEEIKCYEDHRALDGGRDGLNLVRKILKVAPVLLKPQGYLWLEVGLGHPEEIRKAVEDDKQCGLRYIATHEDFTKRDRFCHLQKPFK